MSIGFYELLQVPPDASADAVRTAYQEQVAQVVRKLRAAEARQQDVSGIEARRAALGEAWSVLSDPLRRRRYDRFRQLSRGTLPADPEELWAQAGPSMVDPAAAAAVNVLRTLTDLRVGDAVFEPPPEEPEVSGVVRVAERDARPEPPRVAEPRPERTDSVPRVEVARPERTESVPRIEVPRAEPPRPEPPALRMPEPTLRVAEPPPPPARASEGRNYEPRDSQRSSEPVIRAVEPRDARRTAEPVRSAAPAGLAIDRGVPAEDLARMLDQYGPTGAFLRGARELRRSTLPQLSATTRISMRFLDALERDAFNDLPGATFVRGYLKMVVRALEAIPNGPDADEFIEGYMSRYFRARG